MGSEGWNWPASQNSLIARPMGNTCFGTGEEPNPRAAPSHLPSTEKQQFIEPMAATATAPFKKPAPTKGANMTTSVLGRPTESLRDLYQLGKELGRGQFGITYLCTERSTGLVYACKSIAKRKLVTKDDVDDVRREVQIMHHLSGHPNIVKIKVNTLDGRFAAERFCALCTGM